MQFKAHYVEAFHPHAATIYRDHQREDGNQTLMLEPAPEEFESYEGEREHSFDPANHHTPALPTPRLFDLEVDPRTRTVRRDERTVTLTPHEFNLLQLLIARRGQTVTRSEIRDHLYKHNEHKSNVIDAHICYLRNKIDKGFNLPLILTRWGEGYVFRTEARATFRAPEAANAEIYW